MTEPYRPPLLIVADSPEALTDLCGISLLERMRRVALQLGFREAMILSNSVKAMTTHVANESWRRGDVSLTFRERTGPKVTVDDILDCLTALRVASDGRILIVFAGFYCDERLLRTLADAQTSAVLIDSNPHRLLRSFWKAQMAILPGFCVRLYSRANGFRGKIAVTHS